MRPSPAAAAVPGRLWRQMCSVTFIAGPSSPASLVAAHRQVHVLELQPFDVAPRQLACTTVLPHRDVAEVLVIAARFSVVLPLLAEVAAARLAPLLRVEHHGLGELEEVGDAAGALERLVERLAAAGH